MASAATTPHARPLTPRQAAARARTVPPVEEVDADPDTAPHALIDPWLIDAQLADSHSRWEIGASRTLALAAIPPAVIAAAIALLTETERSPALAISVLSLVAGLYFALHWQLLARGVFATRPWSRWLNASIEGLLPTAVLAVLAQGRGAEWALSSHVYLLYVAFMASAAARLRPLTCVYVGALGIAGYALLYVSILRPELALHGTVGLVAEHAGGERIVWLALIAALMAYATWRVRRLVGAAGAEAWQRRVLEREFGRYMSRDIAAAILSGGRVAERRDVTVLFCDLRDFTALCENQPPERVVEVLNTFFERACNVIESHGGTVNKFLGDGLLALFGAPHDLPDHAHAAAQAAHEIMYAADELRARGGVWADFDIGIGLDSGDVVVGAIGARRRADYTAIGAPVNRAARLQGLSRESDRRIVLSREYVDRLGPRASVVGLGSARLKGISHAVEVFAFRHS